MIIWFQFEAKLDINIKNQNRIAHFLNSCAILLSFLYLCRIKQASFVNAFRQNIISLYLVKISKWFTLIMPIIVLFYEENGLGLKEILLLKSVYSIVSVSLDIPTGYLADAWGRRNCLISGCLIAFGGFVCYSFSDTFYAFLLAEILLGTGQSLVSGADSALFIRYDDKIQPGRRIPQIRRESHHGG